MSGAGPESHGCFACCGEPGGLLPGDRDVRVRVCHVAPGLAGAWHRTTPLLVGVSCFSPECPPSGCVCLLPQTQLRVTAFGQPSLVATSPPKGRGSFLSGAGCWHFSWWGRWVGPPQRRMESLQECQVAPAWAERPFGGPGLAAMCPTEVDGSRHC